MVYNKNETILINKMKLCNTAASRQESIQRLLQKRTEKLHEKPRAEGGDERSLPRAHDAEIEQNQRKDYRQRHIRYVKQYLYIAEILVRGVRDRFDESLAGIHDDVRDNGKRDSEAEDGDSRDDQNEADGVKLCRNERNEKHSKIGEIIEQE